MLKNQQVLLTFLKKLEKLYKNLFYHKLMKKMLNKNEKYYIMKLQMIRRKQFEK